MYNPEFFKESLDKTVLGQERKTMEYFIKKFYETMIHKFKIDSNTLRHLNPLNIFKRDFSPYIQDLINIESFNYEFINKFQKINQKIFNNDNDIDMFDLEEDKNNRYNNKSENLMNKSSNNKFKTNQYIEIENAGNTKAIKIDNPFFINDSIKNKSVILNLKNRDIMTNDSTPINSKIKNTQTYSHEKNEICLKSSKNFDDDQNSCCYDEDLEIEQDNIKHQNNNDCDMFINNYPKINVPPKKFPNIKNQESKFENNFEEPDINKLRANYNLSPNQNFNQYNRSSFQFDLTKKSTNASILSFINKINPSTIKNVNSKDDLFDDQISEISRKYDGNIINKNLDGKRKNYPSYEENINKCKNKKKKLCFK